MKNVIVIIADSLSYEENMLKDMPNLKARNENIISFTNYFAQAPYTEAATVPIYTTSNVTDYQGHMNNIKGRPSNINEIFQSIGYKTYNNLWFYVNTLSFLRGVDEYDYMTSAISLDITTYRIEYFKDLYSKEKFNPEHMGIMISLLDDFFKMTQIYINDYYTKRYKFDLLIKYTEFDKFDFEKFVSKEAENRKEYNRNKEKYIYELLMHENDFFNKNYSKVKRSRSFNERITKLNRSMLPIMTKQIYYSIKNNSENKSLDVLRDRLVNRKGKGVLKAFRGWIGHIGSYPGRYAYDFMSGKVILDRTFEYLSNNQQHKNFVITHLMDTHAPFNFLSSEVEELDDELKKLNQYQKDFKTKENNIYRYSKLYIDEKIESFIKKLEKNDMMEDTTIIITSDHGSSYLGKIFRNEITSTFYDENYRIPLIIYNKNITSKEIDHLAISKQFIPTVLDYLRVENYDQLVDEKSAFKKDNDYIIFEYFGAGCPDYTQKSKLFCIRSKHYKIQYEHYPEPTDKSDQVLAIYNIIEDPKELVNLKDSLNDDKEIVRLLSSLQTRIENII